ncbi:DNA polymerase alpha, subunit B [Clavulina sp. PMI_390]|nr:DNA polymerase alpha, subunit B [Clavulina sp. PMI_390]
MASTEETRKELRGHFGAILDDDEIMEQCVQMCTVFSLSPEDLYYKWQAFSFTASEKDRIITDLDLKGAQQLHDSLRQEARKAKSTMTPATSRIKTVPRSGSRSLLGASMASMLPGSPLANLRRATQPTPSPSSSSLAAEPIVVDHRPKATYVPPSNISEYNYRYMYETIGGRSERLHDIIEDMADRYQNDFCIDDSEIGDPASMSETEMIVVGRICSDSEEKPNESSLLIESPRTIGSGKRVSLQFSPQCSLRSELLGRPFYGFFSGQIVALRGRNGDGLKFVVSEILAPPRLLPQPKGERGDAGDASSNLIMTACGPFSSDKDLEYEPWSKLLAAVQKTQPTVLILMGPFVDLNNSRIKTGAVTQTPLGYFQEHIASKLNNLLGSVPGISIFLVPSPRDIVHSHFAFPQRPFDAEALGISKNINVLPNPCTFTINGINIGVSSVDTLSQIGTQQLIKHIRDVPEPLDGMQLIGLQLLEQRSFYPLFPVPQKESANVNLDVTHSHLLSLDAAPDVLITPSKLKSGYRIVDRTVIVNPGYLTRGTNADSYATIALPPLASVEATMEAAPLRTPSVTPVTADAGAPAANAPPVVEVERTNLPEKVKVEIVKLE